MAASLVKPTLHISARFDHVMDTWSRVCGGAKPTFNNATFLSGNLKFDSFSISLIISNYFYFLFSFKKKNVILLIETFVLLT